MNQTVEAPMENQSQYQIPVTISGRDFVILPMTGDALENWTTARFMFHWRQLCVFRQIKAQIVMPTILDVKDLNQSKRNKLDERCAELSKEWINLANSLIASALRIETPEDAEFVKTVEAPERYRIIGAQDQLNSFNMIEEFEKMEKIQRSAEQISKAINEASDEVEELALGPSKSPPSKLSKKLSKLKKLKKRKK